MSRFVLRSQRTGIERSFSIRDILYLLGDPINDEIFLDAGTEVYNLSSFRSLEAGGSNPEENGTWIRQSFTSQTGGQTLELDYVPLDYGPALVWLNGILQSKGSDYNLYGRQLSFSYPLLSSDRLELLYQTNL